MKAAVYCITLALIGAIFLGAVYSETETQTVTAYDKITDLAPVVQYDKVDSWTHYNPIKNTSGWVGADYEFQTNPSIYTVSEPGTWSEGVHTKVETTTANGVYLIQEAINSNWETGTIIESYSNYDSTGKIIGFVHPSPNTSELPDGTQFYWDASLQKFYVVTGYSDNVPVVSSMSTNLYWSYEPQFTTHVETLDYKVYHQGTTKYIVPGSAVTIPADTTAEWSNGELNGIITLILSPDAAINGVVPAYGSAADSYDLIELTIDRIEDTAHWKGIIDYVSPTNYAVVDYAYQVSLSEAFSTYVGWNGGGNYSYSIERGTFATVTLETLYPVGSTEHATIHVYGSDLTVTMVTAGEDINAVVTGYIDQDTQIVMLDEATTVVYLNATDSPAIRTLSVTGPTTAYVVDTWIESDPDGRLWGDPTIDLGAYFPDIVSNGARVVVSGYVAHGDSVTIGGHTCTVADGSIIIDGAKAIALAGLCVDFLKDGTVKISNGTRSAVLGEYSDAVLSFSGNWYFSSELDSIKERTTTVTNYGIGSFDASVNWCVFTFIGISILTALIAGYYLREGCTALDWAIVVIADVVALTLLVI